jgi:photosystem II stability/assembly factor-like uncharacterized protein
MQKIIRPSVSALFVFLLSMCLTLSISPIPLGGGHGGVALADPGSGWEEQDLPYTEGEITGISAADGETAWAAINIASAPDTGVLKTENGGSDWFIQNLGAPIYGGSTPDVYAVDENIAWTHKWGAAYRTVNGGITWSEAGQFGVPSVHCGAWPQEICALDENTAWYVAWNYNVYDPAHPFFYWSIRKTSDAGSSWNNFDWFLYPASPDFYQGVSSVDVSDDSTVWVSICSGPPVVARSTDLGATWETHELSDLFIYDICAFDSTNAWAIGNATTSHPGTGAGVILRTTDGGATWDTQYSESGLILSAISAVDPSTAWAVGELNLPYASAEKSVILKTDDGGASWTTQYECTGGYLLSVCAVDANTAWVGGKSLSGTPLILKTEDGGDADPEIVSILPASAPPGCEVTIAGSGFSDTQGPSHVLFGAVQASEYTSWSENEIRVRVPAGIEGEVAVIVTTPEGISNPFDFAVMPGPQIDSVTPEQAMQHTLALNLTIGGSGFVPGASVRLEKDGAVIEAFSTSVNSDEELVSAFSLFGAEPGTYDVVVINPDGGEARLPSSFTVNALCGAGSGTAMLILGLTLGLLSLAGTAGWRKRRK